MHVTCLAPAKVNLALHVTGRRADGFHELDSLVAFAPVFDRVTVQRASRSHLVMDGLFADKLDCGGDNLVWRAFELLRGAVGERASPVEIRLEKQLPVAGGIGGGSADAAATLLALARLWNVPGEVDLAELAGQLGSDVPMCLESRPLRANGRGERLTPLQPGGDLHSVLINPGVATPTPAVFRALRNRDNPPMPPAFDTLPSPAFLAGLRNDLEEPAIDVSPQIADILATLRARPSCLLARMSGSGSTCFGLFADEAAAALACREILDTNPHWWCVATRLLGGPLPGRLKISEGAELHEQDR